MAMEEPKMYVVDIIDPDRMKTLGRTVSILFILLLITQIGIGFIEWIARSTDRKINRQC